MQRDETQLLARIAELEAQNAQLREGAKAALAAFTPDVVSFAALERAGVLLNTALAIPADATALDRVRAQAKAEAWEEAAKACDNARHPQSYSGYVEGRNWLCDELSESFLARAAALRQEAQR